MADVAEDYCICHPEDDLDSILSDIYTLKASFDSETNQPESALLHYRNSAKWFGSACDKGFITRPDIRYASGIASMGQGLQGLNRFEEAESYYWKALQIHEEKNLLGIPVIWQLGLALCLRHQRKFEKAQEIAQGIINFWTSKHGKYETKTTLYVYLLSVFISILR